MRSKTGVLVAIKIFQLVGSTACLTLHIYAYSTGLDVPHITVFCGTYMGFGLVNVAFLVSAVMGKPAAEELDMAFGVIGSILFYACGVIGMYQVRQRQYEEQERTHSLEMPNAYDIGPRFFVVTRAQAICSVVTALSFVYDACLKFDMWKYDWDVKRNKLKEDAFDPPDLRLFCFQPCDTWYRNYKRKKEERESENPPTLLVPPSITVQKPTQRLRSSSPTTGESRRRSLHADRRSNSIDFPTNSVSLVQISIPEDDDTSTFSQRSWISPERGATAEGPPSSRSLSPGTPPPPSPPPVPEPSPLRGRAASAPALQAARSPVWPSRSPQSRAAAHGERQESPKRTASPPPATKPSPPAKFQSRSWKQPSCELLDVIVNTASELNSISNASENVTDVGVSKKDKITTRNLPRRRRV